MFILIIPEYLENFNNYQWIIIITLDKLLRANNDAYKQALSFYKGAGSLGTTKIIFTAIYQYYYSL